MDLTIHIDSLLSTAFFAAVFLLGGRLKLPSAIASQRHNVMSFSGGIAVAYVFVRLLPELAAVSEVVVERTAHRGLPFAESILYLAVLLGFVLYYGLEKLVTRLGERQEEGMSGSAYTLRIIGISVYVWLVSYLGVHGIEEGNGPIALYTVALGCHFLATDHGLRREFGQKYKRQGSFIIAAAALAGWAVGAVLEMPMPIVIPLLGVVSGGIIVNTMLEEVPREQEGRFWPFVTGCFLYAAILLAVP